MNDFSLLLNVVQSNVLGKIQLYLEKYIQHILSDFSGNASCRDNLDILLIAFFPGCASKCVNMCVEILMLVTICVATQ